MSCIFHTNTSEMLSTVFKQEYLFVCEFLDYHNLGHCYVIYVYIISYLFI